MPSLSSEVNWNFQVAIWSTSDLAGRSLLGTTGQVNYQSGGSTFRDLSIFRTERVDCHCLALPIAPGKARLALKI